MSWLERDSISGRLINYLVSRQSSLPVQGGLTPMNRQGRMARDQTTSQRNGGPTALACSTTSWLTVKSVTGNWSSVWNGMAPGHQHGNLVRVYRRNLSAATSPNTAAPSHRWKVGAHQQGGPTATHTVSHHKTGRLYIKVPQHTCHIHKTGGKSIRWCVRASYPMKAIPEATNPQRHNAANIIILSAPFKEPALGRRNQR